MTRASRSHDTCDSPQHRDDPMEAAATGVTGSAPTKLLTMRILSIQSSVAYGHVGNSAATFPFTTPPRPTCEPPR